MVLSWLLFLVAVCTATAPASAAFMPSVSRRLLNSTTLSNGATLSVHLELDDPSLSGGLPLEPGVPIGLQGNASISLGDPDVSYIYILDTSNTTARPDFPCASVLECVRNFLLDLHTQITDQRAAQGVAILTFDESATVRQNWFDPRDPQEQTTAFDALIGVAANADVATTDCEAALEAATALVNSPENTATETVVVMVGDGQCDSSTGFDLIQAADDLANAGAVVYTLAVGDLVDCSNQPAAQNELADIPRNGGSCIWVPDPHLLSNYIDDVLQSTSMVTQTNLTQLQYNVDGGNYTDVLGLVLQEDGANTSLPQPGAVAVNFDMVIPGFMVAGNHTICAMATGEDAMGLSSQIQDCRNILIAPLPSAAPSTSMIPTAAPSLTPLGDTATLSNGAKLNLLLDINDTSAGLPLEPGVPVGIQGTASMGLGDPNVAYIYIMDTSNSTSRIDFPCLTVFDCVLEFFLQLDTELLQTGYSQGTAILTFDETVTVQQDWFDPRDPNEATTTFDALAAASPSTVATTNCQDALTAAAALVNSSTVDTTVVVLAGDGNCNVGNTSQAADALADTGAIVYTVAVGDAVDCTNTMESQQELADIPRNGGSCISVPDPHLLSDFLDDIVQSNLTNVDDLIRTNLTSLEYNVDGGNYTDIVGLSSGMVNVSLPQPGAVVVDFDTEIASGLTAGTHEICARAFGEDVLGGSAQVVDCQQIFIADAPSATPSMAPSESIAPSTAPSMSPENTTVLTNGAELSVLIEIDDPTMVGDYPLEPGVAVGIQGFASVSLGEPYVSYIYILDESASTSTPYRPSCPRALFCLQEFLVGFHDSVVQDGTAELAAVITLDEVATLRADWFDPRDPAEATTAFEALALASPGTAATTNCVDALTVAADLVASQNNTASTTVVVMAGHSPCSSNGTQTAADALQATGAIVYTVAVGDLVNCSNPLDEFAGIPRNGGTCIPVADPNNLPDFVDDITGTNFTASLKTNLTSLEYNVDGGNYTDISFDNDTDVTFPQEGPVSVEFNMSIASGLSIGNHIICARAAATDALGGFSQIEDCSDIFIAEAPSVAPTGAPSMTPTGTPSMTPTGTPSGAPTGLPTMAPSTAASEGSDDGFEIWEIVVICIGGVIGAVVLMLVAKLFLSKRGGRYVEENIVADDWVV